MDGLILAGLMIVGVSFAFSWAWYNFFLWPFMVATYIVIIIVTCMGANPALLITMTLGLIWPWVGYFLPREPKLDTRPTIHMSPYNGSATGTVCLSVDDDYDASVYLTRVLAKSGYTVVEHLPLSAKVMKHRSHGWIDYCKIELRRTPASVLVTVSSTNEAQHKGAAEQHVEALLNLFCDSV